MTGSLIKSKDYNGDPPWIDYKQWIFFKTGQYIMDSFETKNKYTTIDYIPSFKGVVITEYIRPEILVTKNNIKKATGAELISLSEVKDSDLIAMGLNSKGATVANAGSEDQASFVIIAMGLKVDTDEFKLGDKVLLRSAAQPIGLEVGGKLYGQIHEYEIAGKLLN